MAQPSIPDRATGTIPASAGIGFRADHYRDIVEQQPTVGWFEVHSENYFGMSGLPIHQLETLRRDFPLSLHGVGMSLGSTEPLDLLHLKTLKTLIRRCEPGLVSEHVSWGAYAGRYLNDLAPVPYTEEALGHFVARITQVQDYLGQQILIENPSSYLEYRHSEFAEWDFLVAVVKQSGAGLLLDVNNVFVSSVNHGWDACRYLKSIPVDLVKEIHLAGHTRKSIAGFEVLIDTHDQAVCEEVWSLYEFSVERFGACPVLIERDANLPPLIELVAEARRAQHALEVAHALAA